MKGFGLYLIILVCLLAGVSYVVSQTQQTETLSYNQIYNYFMDGDVDQYDVDDTTLTMHLKKENQTYTYDLGDYRSVFYNDLGETIQQQMRDGTLTKVDYRTATIPWWAQFLPYVILIVLLIAFWCFMMNKQSGGGAGPMQFGKARAKLAQDDKRKVTFNDVAGADEEKAELQEIVEFLKNPQKFVQIGARIPKGVLLVGPPGTGKTLIARAVAGEAGVPFLSISGSDFVELYVGVGASRVRDLFEQAKKNAPAIVFIDEIDAVGRQRGAGLGGGHDEREQTLNQLLVEMDGFGANEGVIVIAATNRKDILDNALLRPGRFDRQVYVGAPDVKGREAILKVHARNKQFDPDVKFSDIAKTTAGFTGADLENLLNEAALLAARRNKKLISQEEIEESLLKVVMGVEKKSHIITEHDKRLTAYHEAGHAICFHVLPTQDPVHHVTIIPRSSGAGGFTMPLPEEDDRESRARQRLLEINRCAARYFYENLNAKTPEAAMARRYWKEKRGLSDAAIRRFGLGYAPEDFGGLLHYLKRRGFSEEELETSGLVKRSAKGNLYDIFRHRVMVPIIDVRGAIIAFGGRVLDDSKPKYINSPETMVYHKSRTLFALNIAKKSKNRRYILCEGYMDVISMHEAGFDTAVCACGTALTPEQAKLLSEYADEVVLSYDSDEAGQKATERSLGILGSTTLKVSVLSYQGAKDPDEFIKKYGRERFEMLLNGTANPTEFQLKKSKAKYDLRSDDGRLSYIREAIEILTERGVSPTARDVYAGRLADETGVSKQAILSQLNGALQAAARRSYRKEQRDLSKEGIASDIRVPYTSSGESALGAANAARQLAVAMLQDPEQVPYVRARLDMSTVLVPEMQRALEAIFRCVDEHLPLNQTSLQQMLDEAAFRQLAHGQAYNHDIRLQRQDIDMYLDRLQTAKPISEQVKDMSDGQLESYFANLGKKKGARPAETDE